ncbi:hypothetical protein [Larkinella terrae]|uniref:Uncharacterized protein n=1 Tax=Larkinella terrae TaxID=2025311 RepID=A0A7K0EKD8_9BACT|nr:hypothetical protein [Larkinella terrae]MRS62264.1 hypothetical protein [Larkinella terrae]
MKDDIFSPEGTYVIQFDVFEVKMSHWIETPRIFRVADNQLLFDLRGDVWSAMRINWLSESRLELLVAKYPGRISCHLFLDLQTDRGAGTADNDRFEGNLSGLENWVRQH